MKELEVKILGVNRKKIEETLTGLGAKKVFDGDIQTLFFDFKDGAIIKAKDVLRLRKEQDKTELTYKKIHIAQTAKVAEEYSVEVSNLETTKQILENLGLSVIESMQKHRVSYTLDQARFDIDRYAGNYGYIEKVAVSWMLSDNPKATQEELLENFKKEHGEYPAWNFSKKTSVNSQSTSKVAPKSCQSSSHS